MNSCLRCVTLLSVLLFLAVPLHAGQCIQGWDDNNPQDPPPTYTWTNDFIALQRLGSHYMPSYGDGDSMTEPISLYGGMNQPFGSDGIHETWYVARDNIAGTSPFYRLLGGQDHMDSDNPNEAPGWYTSEMTLGYPWSSSFPAGAVPLTRWMKSSIFDHRTWPGQPTGYTLDHTWDGSSGPARYGFKRFGNKLQWCDVDAMTYTKSLANTKLKIDFNTVWGDAIGRIYWKGTNPWTQLVREQIGAMVQSTIFNTVPDPDHPTGDPLCCDYNPTQSGGADIKNLGNTRRWAGSPTFNQSLTSSTYVSEIKPFNFSFTEWPNTDPWSPLMWRGTFKKTTTLGFNIAGTVYPDVFLMRFEAKRDNTAVKADGHNLNNTYWLTMNLLGNGNNTNAFRIEMVNLDSGATEQFVHPRGRFDSTNPEGPPNLARNTIALPADGRGVLLSSNDSTFAMGFETPNSPQAYHLMYWCDGGAVTNGNCDFTFQTVVFNTFASHTLSTAYDYSKRQDMYMIVGTRADVLRRLKQIKCALNGGGSACNNIL